MKLGIPAVFILFCAAVWEESEGGPLSQGEKTNLTKGETDRLMEVWNQYAPRYSEDQQVAIEYPCGPLPKSSSIPTSVHKLRPGDVKVIGALGDSLTAGTGIEATNIIMVLIQNRGLSWSGGGETTFTQQITLPNILKMYNPDVYGFATGDGDEDSSRSMFNVAISGSTSSDLVNQVQEMILRMKNDPSVDFDNDWKVITILSGNNDLCDFCKQRDDINLEEFVEHVTSALDILHAQLPRALVNLVQPLNMEIVTELNKGLLCSTLHFLLCDCAAFPDDAEAEVELILEADLYQKAVEEIALSGRYDTRDDFTVVSQPFFNATYLPRLEDGQPDMSYFAPDCFHLSRKGQAAAASALWNNMIEPVHSKRTKWSPGEPIECPTEDHPYFYTNKNSGFAQGHEQVFQQQQQQQKPEEGNEDQKMELQFQQGPENGDEEDETIPMKPGHKTHTGAPTHNFGVGTVAGAGAAVVVAVVAGLVYRHKQRPYSYEAI